jgi:ubiquinone/menaquinone biosynthesis C-methylase UbiE
LKARRQGIDVRAIPSIDWIRLQAAMRDVLSSVRPGNSLQYACPRCRTKLDLSVQDGRCSACGHQPRRSGDILSFANDLEQDRWQKLFDKQATKPGDDTVATICYRSQLLHRYVIDGFRRLCIPLVPGGRALDVGCGNGIFWAALFGTPNVIGIDYSLGMCKLARARGMLADHANALGLPFAEHQFDLVYSAEIVQYVDDLPTLLSEMARVCRPGGRVVVSTLNRSSALRRAVLAAKAAAGRASADDPVYLRTAKEIAEAAMGLPLGVESVWWIHFPAPQVVCTTNVRRHFEWLASNVIIRFVRSG